MAEPVEKIFTLKCVVRQMRSVLKTFGAEFYEPENTAAVLNRSSLTSLGTFPPKRIPLEKIHLHLNWLVLDFSVQSKDASSHKNVIPDVSFCCTQNRNSGTQRTENRRCLRQEKSKTCFLLEKVLTS